MKKALAIISLLAFALASYGDVTKYHSLVARKKASVVGTSPGTANLIAWWGFEDASGNLLDDHTTNVDLTASGTPTYSQTGLVNNAITFTGSNPDYFSLNNATETNVEAYPYSFGGWFKTSTASDMTIYYHGRDDVVNNFTYLEVTSAGEVQFTTRNSYIDTISTSGGSFNDGSWHLIIMVLVSGEERYMYIDNVQYGGGGRTNIVFNAGWDDITIGRRGDSTPSNPFTGTLDEAFFFDDELTSDELTWLYNNGNGRDFGDL